MTQIDDIYRGTWPGADISRESQILLGRTSEDISYSDTTLVSNNHIMMSCYSGDSFQCDAAHIPLVFAEHGSQIRD